MRFLTLVLLLVSMQIASTAAETPPTAETPTVKQQLAEIDLRVMLKRYEKLASMLSDTEIEVALLEVGSETYDAQRKALEQRLVVLKGLKLQTAKSAELIHL